MELVDISVVIATLGGNTTSRTVSLLNSGSTKPEEILICIPYEYESRVDDLKEINNVKIISTKCKGQVPQRIEGFKKAVSQYVLQLDDDMYIYGVGYTLIAAFLVSVFFVLS